MLFIKQHIHLILLSLLCLVLFTSHTLYVLATSQYPTWDEVHYIGYAVRFFDIFHAPSPAMFSTYFGSLNERQPLYSLFITIPLLLFGTEHSYKTALLLNGFFYVGTTVSIYFLAKEFFSKTASLLAAFVFAMYGFPLFYLHFTYTETSATAWTVLSLLFLKKTELFRNRRYIFFFSAAFAAAILTRWSTPIFIIGPFLYVIFLSLLSLYQLRKKRVVATKTFLAHIGIFIGIALFIPFLTYYLPVRDDFLGYLNSGTSNAKEWVSSISYLPPGLENPLSVHSMMFYFNIISQQTVFFFFLFGLGTLFGFFYYKKYLFLLLGFFVPYAFFTFISIYKDDRFIVPLYPMVAMISAICLEHFFLRKRFVKEGMITVIILLGSLNFLGSSWAIGPMGQQGLKDIVTPKFVPHPRRIYLTSMVWPPRQSASGAALIAYLDHIDKTEFPAGKRPVFFHTYVMDQIDGEMALRAVYERREYMRLITPPQKRSITEIPPSEYDTLYQMLDEADIVITKDRPIPKEKVLENADMILSLHRVIKEGKLPTAFSEIHRIAVPLDQTELIIYKKVRPITETEWGLFQKNFPHMPEA